MFITQKEWFSVEQCDANPKNLYVFGDNAERYGNAGQAQIRFCKNSIGIATKYAPGRNEKDYFNDSPRALEIMENDINALMEEAKNYDNVIFPYDGLGTGLSEMPKRCPLLFRILNYLLSNHFEINYKDYL